MIHFQGQPGLATTILRQFLGGQDNSAGTPGVSDVNANAWLARAAKVYSVTHSRTAATGVGNTFEVRIYDGVTLLHTFSYANGDGTSKREEIAGGVTLTAASDGNPGQAFLLHQVLTAGAATADGAFGFVYQDSLDSTISLHTAGEGPANLTVAGTTEFFGVHTGGTGGATTENNAQVVWPRAGTMQYLAIVYETGADNSYDLLIRRNGATAATIALPIAAGGALILNTTTQVTIATNDLICFGLTRTAGADTEASCCVTFGFIASS
jgi:hypothetical protein